MGFLSRHRLGLTSLLVLLAAPFSFAQTTREYDLKAAFLYNFLSFVDWPPQALSAPETPFVIGVIGSDPFGSVLNEMVRGERVNGRPIVIRRLSRPAEASQCHILFVSRSEAGGVGEVLRHCRGRAILTVGDMPGFAEAGGMIEFVTEGSRVLLHVNATAAAEAELVISSKLLRVARNVTGANNP